MDPEEIPSATLFVTNFTEPDTPDVENSASSLPGFISSRSRKDRRMNPCAFIEFDSINAAISAREFLLAELPARCPTIRVKYSVASGSSARPAPSHRFDERRPPPPSSSSSSQYPQDHEPYQPSSYREEPRYSAPSQRYPPPGAFKRPYGPEPVTLYIEGVPMGAQKREVAHILRAFPGYISCRLRLSKTGAYVLCFTEFDSVHTARAVIDTLTGYAFDEDDVSSPRLSVSFSDNKRRDY